jgi:SAM-dependent methyltransferase
MDDHDEFEGTPWQATPTAEWNAPPFWDGYYRDLLAEAESWQRGQVTHRRIGYLVRTRTAAGELPKRATPATFLDAGCGVSLVPHVFAFWGFEVTAIDSCPRAIEASAQLRPDEKELARCIDIWDPCPDSPRSRQLVEDPARSLQVLRGFQSPGGSLTHVADDWFSADLRPGSFALVYCRNALRCSTKPYWRRSLGRFHELLSPGGVLVLENVNAIGIMDEVEGLLAAGGFVSLATPDGRTADGRHVLTMWPTG